MTQENKYRLFSYAVVAVTALFADTTQAQLNPARWKAVEQWRVDGAPGEPFGDIRDYVVTKDGSLWILDFKDQDIRRFDTNGKPLTTVGRKGRGPGEMYNANGLAIGPDGAVWVNDPSNSRIVIFGIDGKFQRQISSGAMGYTYRWMVSTNRKAKELVEQSLAAVTTWKRYDVSGKVLGTAPFTGCSAGSTAFAGYRAETKGKGSTMGSYPFTTGGGLVPDNEGNVWCASPVSTRAALVRIGTHDTIAQTVVDIQSMPVGDAERDDVIASIEKRLSEYETSNFDKARVPRTKSGIGALQVDEEDRLWVQHTTKFKVKEATFDVFDSHGKHVSRLTLPVNHRGYLPLRARGDDLWITVVDDDDVPSVVKFRLQK